MRILGSMLLIAIFIMPLSGQIVIDWTEIPQTIGTTWRENTAHNVTVDLGSTGSGQTWDFTSQPMGPDSSRTIIVSKASTPFGDSFPNANSTWKTIADNDTTYMYWQLASSFMSLQGVGGNVSDSTFLIQYDPIDSTPLPLTYGASYHYNYGFTIEDPPITLETRFYGFRIVDAWGTVTIPYGSFPCLRGCDYDTCAITAFVASIPIFGDTTTHINYMWFAENRYGVVTICSHPDETNPNYTNAATLDRLTYFSTGIEELIESKTNCLSHHPSPFSDHVEIHYTITKQDYIDLKIYDANGKLVKTIVNQLQPLGNYTVKWFGKNEAGDLLPSGAYFYNLRVDGTNSIGKVLLVR